MLKRIGDARLTSQLNAVDQARMSCQRDPCAPFSPSVVFRRMSAFTIYQDRKNSEHVTNATV